MTKEEELQLQRLLKRLALGELDHLLILNERPDGPQIAAHLRSYPLASCTYIDPDPQRLQKVKALWPACHCGPWAALGPLVDSSSMGQGASKVLLNCHTVPQLDALWSHLAKGATLVVRAQKAASPLCTLPTSTMHYDQLTIVNGN